MNYSTSKIDLALIQLRTAVQLYSKGNYISSLTLAGASEEVLGQIAKNKSGTNALIDDKAWTDQIADYFKKPRPPLNEVAKIRNKAKNEIKHNDNGVNYEIVHDFKFEAETFILGAIRNFELITGAMPNDRIIKSFWNWISM
jgi:hypothetical protein